MYKKNIIIGMSVVIFVIFIAVFVFYWSKDSCPLGTFQCATQGKCVPQKFVCNGHNDCQNGNDEDMALCADWTGSVNMVDKIINKSFISYIEIFRNEHNCYIKKYPSECVCKFSTRLFCKGLNLTEVPHDISKNVTYLVLANNSIQNLGRNSFSRYNLKLIHLEGNNLQRMPPYVFKEQLQLEKLLLMNNNLKEIQRNVLVGLKKLLWLFLENNDLRTIYLKDLEYLSSLEWINLSHNKLTLENQYFPEMPNLLEAFLDYNEITRVENNTFRLLLMLELLDLFGNHLIVLPNKVFDSQILLSRMYLGQNPLDFIPEEIFIQLRNLASLNMEGIEIANIDVNMFSSLKNLKSVYFKKYHYCSYAPSVNRCRPLSDGVSSLHQLLSKPIIRYCLWTISLMTCFGNMLVMWGRFVFKDENKVLSFVIRNLAASDFLMGIYLIIIVFHDYKFRDIYNKEAFVWMSSWTCVCTGIIAMISSEVSVLIIVFMSIDRFLLIAIPFGRYSSLTMRDTILILVSIWTLGTGIAIVPALHLSSSTKFYGVNGLCFPLHIDDPYLIGWKVSALIFFGLNAFSLVVVGIVYLGMFLSILKTRNATSLPIKDYEFAIRFFFIVVINASCWLPIIIAKVFPYFGKEISADTYGWLVVFVLPINSALNPFIYTFTTAKYRAQVSRVAISNCVQPLPPAQIKRRQSPQSTGESGSLPLTIRSGQSFNTKSVLSKF